MSHKGEKFRSISISSEGICELYKVKYTHKKLHSSMQADDREEKRISEVMFAFLSIFSINSTTDTTGIPVTNYSTLELSNRVIVLDLIYICIQNIIKISQRYIRLLSAIRKSNHPCTGHTV